MAVRILVVDNVEADAVVVRDHLITQEYDVELLHDSRDAYDDLVQGDSFDLLILDVSLSGLDGITLAKRLRQRRIMIPVLFLAAGVDPAVKLSIAAMGPTAGYLEWSSKGSRELLLAACTDLISRNHFMTVVLALGQQVSDLHAMVSEKMPTTDGILRIIAENRNVECPVYHAAVKEEVFQAHDQSAIEVEKKVTERIEAATKELTTVVTQATEASHLFTKLQDHPMFKVILALSGTLIAVYLAFAGYSYTLADQSSRDVVLVKYQVQDLGLKIDGRMNQQVIQMSRIEQALDVLSEAEIRAHPGVLHFRPFHPSIPPTLVSTATAPVTGSIP